MNNFYNFTNIYSYVDGIEGAKNYPVSSNQMVLLIDNNQPYIYMKSANALGQSSIRYFKIEEVKEPKVKTDYITREEMEEMLKALKEGKNNESNVTE